MTTTTPAHPAAAAYRTYANAVADARASNDADLTADANARRRADAIRAARVALTSAIPAEPTRTHTRESVYAGRAPRAEEVPLHDNERRKLVELRAAGWSWARIVASASELRVNALIDGLEGIAAIDAGDAAALSDMLWARLVELGAADAVQAEEEEARTSADAAWRDALTATAEGRAVSVGTWTAIHAADRPGYTATLGEGLVIDHDALNRIAPPEVTE